MSTMPNEQPVLPAETPLTDLERFFIDLQPINLWPANQNSNFGLIRGLALSPLQEVVTLLSELSNEMFASTTSGYMERWEDELGLPRGQGGRSISQRRRTILSRLAIGPFSHSRRNSVIEAAISDTFGDVPAFTAEGIELTSGGIIFHAEAGDVTALYRVVESIEQRSYQVRILDSVDVDVDWLTRELAWMTPGGKSFTINLVPVP